MRQIPWVIVDVSYLAHRARIALDGFEFEDVPTGVIYGFFEQLLSVCYDDRIRSNKVILCFDSKKSYRKKFYPEYKKKKKDDRTEEELRQLRVMHEQVEKLRTKILPDIGFEIKKQSGLESDDLMSASALWADRKKQYAVIVTGDGDLYQNITHYVHWYDPGRSSYIDYLEFWKRKGIDPDKWAEVKAIAGCPSDNVEGIYRVGEKSAITYLLGKFKPESKVCKKIDNQQSNIISRNRKLVRLPHSKTRPVSLSEPQYKPDEFFRYAGQYGIRTYLDGKGYRKWMNFFSGEFDKVKSKARKRNAR